MRGNFLKWTLLRRKEQGTYEVAWRVITKDCGVYAGYREYHTGSRVPICREIMSLHYKIRPLLYGSLLQASLRHACHIPTLAIGR